MALWSLPLEEDEAFEDDEASEDDDDFDDDEDDEDGNASSSSADEMSTWYSYPLSLVIKRGSSFGNKSSHSSGKG